MRFTKGKIKILASTILSLFAVFVGAIASFAWFQVNTTQTYNPVSPSLVTSDSTSLSITGITAYKAKYAQSGYDQIDYSRYEVEDYSTTDATPENTDKTTRRDLETPTEGEGYYIVGNAGWVADYNYKFDLSKTPATDAWKYSAALKMESSVIKDGSDNLPNKAVYDDGIYLSANTQIKLKHHYVDTDDLETHDDWLGTYGGVSGAGTSSSDIEASEGNIKINTAGYYKIYLNNSNAVYFYRVTTTKQKVLARHGSPTRKEAKVTGKDQGIVFLKPGSNWDSAGARFAIYVFTSDKTKEAWASMYKFNDSYYVVRIPAVPSGKTTWDNLIFCRMNGATSTNEWNNRWNQTGDLSFNQGIVYNKPNATWDGSGDSGNWSTTLNQTATTGDFKLYYDNGAANWPGIFLKFNTADGDYLTASSSFSLAKDRHFNLYFLSNNYKISNSSVFFDNDDTGTKAKFAGEYNVKLYYDGSYDVTGDFTAASEAPTKKTYYISSDVASWYSDSATFALFAYNSAGNAKLVAVTSQISNIYTAAISTTYTNLWFVRRDPGNSDKVSSVWNKTTDLAKQTGNNDWYKITSESAGIYYGGWNIFYRSGSNNGYYLVGTSSFAVGGVPWVFNDANYMSESNCPTDVTAILKSKTVAANSQFQVWQYNTSTGKGTTYNTINNDVETNSVLTMDGSNMKFTQAGTYDIWFTSYNKVVVKSSSTGATLWVSDLDEEEDTSYTASFGTNCTAVYEQGVHITDDMAAGDGCAVAFVINYGGNKTQYGDVNTTPSYGFVSGTSSVDFDGCSPDDCLVINKPGYYNFYLISGKINIISRPYKTNGSDVYQSNGDYGYYLIPYTSAGFNTSFKNGIKMAPVTGTNHAEYTKYIVANSSGEYIYFRRFENGTTTNSKIIGNISAHSSAAEKITVFGTGENQYVKLNQGTYNIFIYEEGGVEKVSIASHTLSDFSTLNSIPSNATTYSAVQGNYSTIVLDISFTVKESKAFTVEASRIVPSNLANGVSKYARYAFYVDTTFASNTPTAKWDALRELAFASSGAALKTMGSTSSLSGTLSTSVAANAHHAYIVIDYDWNKVSEMPKLTSALVNDFYFVMSISL